jgi:glycosyltransferase involved in cell wall biosynthesis
VIIAAHNEESVIRPCIEGLIRDVRPGTVEVVVAANGCADRTAAVARSIPGTTVLELPVPGKVAALNLAETRATCFPRVYLDADIRLSSADLRRLCRAVADSPTDAEAPSLAAYPRRVLDLVGRPLLVRSYFAINRELPVFREGLFGRGVIVLSESARSRFDRFPDVIADDLFLDSLFTASEKREVQDVAAVVATPLRTRDLIFRLVRVRRGNAQLRRDAQHGGKGQAPAVRSADRWAWLTKVVLRRPSLIVAAPGYVAITLMAEFLARRSPETRDWGRDESTRAPSPTSPEC